MILRVDFPLNLQKNIGVGEETDIRSGKKCRVDSRQRTIQLHLDSFTKLKQSCPGKRRVPRVPIELAPHR